MEYDIQKFWVTAYLKNCQEAVGVAGMSTVDGGSAGVIVEALGKLLIDMFVAVKKSHWR